MALFSIQSITVKKGFVWRMWLKSTVNKLNSIIHIIIIWWTETDAFITIWRDSNFNFVLLVVYVCTFVLHFIQIDVLDGEIGVVLLWIFQTLLIAETSNKGNFSTSESLLVLFFYFRDQICFLFLLVFLRNLIIIFVDMTYRKFLSVVYKQVLIYRSYLLSSSLVLFILFNLVLLCELLNWIH